MAMVTIGAVTLNAHDDYEVTVQDIYSEATGRGEDGALTLVYVATKHTVRGTYRVPASDIDNIAGVVTHGSFSVTFYNPYVVGLSTTATMYASDRVAKLLTLVTGAEATAYWDLSFTLIEI